MINRFLQIIGRGWHALVSNKSLWLAVFIGLVVPILFVLLTRSIFSTTETNITTVEKARISALHDVIAYSLGSLPDHEASLSALLTAVTANQRDVENVKVAQVLPGNNVRILASTDAASIGQIASTTNLERTALTQPGQSFIFEFLTVSGDRVWQVYRALDPAPGVVYYISSEHNFSEIDTTLQNRTDATYALLILIIFSLLLFVYFATKQVDYESKYKDSVVRQREQEIFMGAVVHELRAPLTAIRGYASNIEETTEASTETRSSGAQIKKAATRLVALIGDYLNVIQLRSGTEKVTLTEVPLVATLRAVISELLPTALEKNLNLSVTSPGVEVPLQANQKFLTQIFTNLVSNSIKYTIEGRIEVEITLKTREVEVRIKDTGFGMSAEDQQKLFAPFTRVGSGKQMENITGSGLGMWLTKLMVEKLNGTIGVESIKDIGTHVVVRFKR